MAPNSVVFPFWRILKEVFAACWRELRFALRCALVPFAITVLVDVAGTLAGVNVLAEYYWIFVAQITFLIASASPTVSWTLHLVGDPSAGQRPLFKVGDTEWHVINANLVASILFVGGGAILAVIVLRATTAVHAVGQLFTAAFFYVLALPALALVGVSYARLSFAPALAALGHPHYIRSAWAMTRSLRIRFALLYLACIFVFAFVSQLGALIIDTLGELAGVADEDNPGLWILGVSVSTSFFNLLLLFISNALFANIVVRLEAAQTSQAAAPAMADLIETPESV